MINSPSVHTRNLAGFTLIELLVVIVILTLFAGMMSMSVGSSNSRKNRAFYEHFIDTLSYVRLLSAEQMQPMGLTLQADNQGQVQPVVVQLDNPYAPFATLAQQESEIRSTDRTKNAMELSTMPSTFGNGTESPEAVLPTWTIAEQVSMPALPQDVEITMIPIEGNGNNGGGITQTNKTLQPWFIGNDVPQALWFGTGSAAPVRIEIRYKGRLVGDAIVVNSDGRIGQET